MDIEIDDTVQPRITLGDIKDYLTDEKYKEETITVELTVEDILTLRDTLYYYARKELWFSGALQEKMHELSCHLYDSIVNHAENNQQGDK